MAGGRRRQRLTLPRHSKDELWSELSQFRLGQQLDLSLTRLNRGFHRRCLRLRGLTLRQLLGSPGLTRILSVENAAKKHELSL